MKLFLVSFVLEERSVENAHDNGEATASIHDDLNHIYPELDTIRVVVANDVPEDKVRERTIALLAN